MATLNISTRNEQLIQNIKDCGRSLIDNAEKIANDFKYHTNLTITCYPFDSDECPHIVVETEFLPENIVKRFEDGTYNV